MASSISRGQAQMAKARMMGYALPGGAKGASDADRDAIKERRKRENEDSFGVFRDDTPGLNLFRIAQLINLPRTRFANQLGFEKRHLKRRPLELLSDARQITGGGMAQSADGPPVQKS